MCRAKAHGNSYYMFWSTVGTRRLRTFSANKINHNPACDKFPIYGCDNFPIYKHGINFIRRDGRRVMLSIDLSPIAVDLFLRAYRYR